MSQSKLLTRQGGFTLTELAVSGALVGILCLIVATAFELISHHSSAYSINITRDSLMMDMRKTVGDLNSLRASLHQPENTSLLSCVCGSPAGCISGQSTPMSLYRVGDTPPRASTNYYDINGSPCQQTDANCLIQTQVTFTAQCPPTLLPSANPMPASSCTTPAEVIGFFFTIQPNPALTNPGIALKTLRGVAYVQAASISASTPAVCP